MQDANITSRKPSHEKSRPRAHRSLPRNQDLIVNDSPSASSHGEPDNSSPLSITIAFQTTPTLPLTPPSIPLDSQKHSSSGQSSGGLNTPVPNVSGNATPTRRINLLTPDITPPRVVSHLRKREGLAQQQPSMSSRAESFTTAQEGLSDEDTERLRNANTVPLQTGKQRLPHPLRKAAVHEPLTNLGHEFPQNGKSQSKSSDTRSVDPKNESRIRHGNEMSAPPPGNKKHRRTGSSKSARSDPRDRSTHRGRSLREGVHGSQEYPDNSTIEDFGERIGWISNNEDWRMSGASATSTIEAVVIDTPPQKQRTLRHSAKRESLRSISAPVPRPQRGISSNKPHDHPQRLVHKSRRLSNENRASVASDISAAISVGSERPKRKEEIIPVVVIPERRSSLKSSLPSSRRNSRSQSVASARRPATAPDSGTRHFEGSRKRRTFSESLPTGLNAKDSGRYPFQPKIPTRRSSLSAPTSRNGSRAGSLTAESVRNLEAQNLPSVPREEAKVSQTDNPPITRNAAVAQGNTAPVPSIDQALSPHGEFLRFQTPPTPWTPFQASVQSLSPGPVEISEAKLVPLFAHNNESLMLIEKLSNPESRDAHGSNSREAAKDLPRTPAHLNDPGAADVDSPLRNPRPPPKPPALKAIPPTPLERPTHRLGNLPSQSSESSNGITRRFGSMRRAMSGRRNSEPSSSRPPAHRFRNRNAGKELDSKLHPFWRPRGFWEDFDGDGSNNNNTRSLSLPRRTNTSSNDDDHYIGNSLGLPQKRVAFQGPMTLIRRVSKRNRSRNNTRLNSGSHTSLTSLGSRHSGKLSRRRGGSLGSSNSSLRLPLVTLRRLQEWAIRSKEQREQAKLEARRDEIRRNIGGRILVNQSLVPSAGPNHHISVNNVSVT